MSDAAIRLWWRRKILPGFGLSMGFTLLYLSLIVLIPLSAMLFKSSGLGWETFLRTILQSERVQAAFRLSFSTALYAAMINALLGIVVAWVLVRYPFPGNKILDAFVDLPFALPTAVAGITLAALYSTNGWLGRPIFALTQQKIAYTELGILVALIFVGLPFVVRTVQPVLEDLDLAYEEAAASLGASRFRTILRVVLPAIWPAVVTGFALAFARAVGEYGSVIFIAGNLPRKTEIAPLLIVMKLDEAFDYQGATAIAMVMLLISLVMLLIINGLQRWSKRRIAPGK